MAVTGTTRARIGGAPRGAWVLSAALALAALGGAAAWRLSPWRPWVAGVRAPVAPGRPPELADGRTDGLRRVRALDGRDVDLVIGGTGGGRALARSARAADPRVFFDVPAGGAGWVDYAAAPPGRLEIHLHDRREVVR